MSGYLFHLVELVQHLKTFFVASLVILHLLLPLSFFHHVLCFHSMNCFHSGFKFIELLLCTFTDVLSKHQELELIKYFQVVSELYHIVCSINSFDSVEVVLSGQQFDFLY